MVGGGHGHFFHLVGSSPIFFFFFSPRYFCCWYVFCHFDLERPVLYHTMSISTFSHTNNGISLSCGCGKRVGPNEHDGRDYKLHPFPLPSTKLLILWFWVLAFKGETSRCMFFTKISFYRCHFIHGQIQYWLSANANISQLFGRRDTFALTN